MVDERHDYGQCDMMNWGRAGCLERAKLGLLCAGLKCIAGRC